MRRASRHPLMLLCLAAQYSAAVAADVQMAATSSSNLSHLSIEQLADIEVSSVSKRPERLADAPAAIYVITREDIREAGVTTLPEALRLAPNLQVARSNANTYAITARGFNGSNANKLLVLIDGRSVYTPLQAGVFWDVQDVMLDDIDRIEVVSGPGGTLWGANAVNGVINILTRSSRDTHGTRVVVDAGTDERGVALRHGFSLGEDATLRLYAKGFEVDHSERADGRALVDAWNLNQAGFRADWARSGNAFTMQGDAYEGKAQVSATSPDRKVSGANVLGRWNRDLGHGAGLQVQAYVDRYRRDQPGVFTEEMSTLDIDVQHHIPLGDRHDIVWGGGLRHQHDSTTGSTLLAFVPADSTLTLANVFAQDSYSINERTKLTFGLKLERNNYTGVEVQPNLRLAWRIDDRALLWSALSRAVRTPSRVDRDLQITPPTGPGLLTSPGFVSEKLTAFELGYRAQPSARTSFSVSAYFNDYDKLRSIEPDGSGNFVLGNGIAGHTYGIEGWGSFQASETWRLSAGYRHINERMHFKPGSAAIGQASAGNDPHYKFTLRSSWTLPRDWVFDVGLRANGALPNPPVPSYVAVDARVAWTVSRGVELSLAGFNLFDRSHPEFGAAPARSEVARSFALKLRWDL
jgi:iron complex outermembrane receptor protein